MEGFKVGEVGLCAGAPGGGTRGCFDVCATCTRTWTPGRLRAISFYRAGNVSCDGRAAVRPLQEPQCWCREGDILLSQLNTSLLIPLLLIPRSVNAKPQPLTDVPALDKTDASARLICKSLHLPRHAYGFVPASLNTACQRPAEDRRQNLSACRTC